MVSPCVAAPLSVSLTRFLNNSDLTVGHSALDVMGSSGYLDVDDDVTDDDHTWPRSQSQAGSSANWVTQR